MSGAMAATKLQPGEWVAEKKAIFIGEFDDLVRADIPARLAHTANLDRCTRWYDAALDLKPDTFDNLVKTIAGLNVNGRTGIGFDPAAYEERLFEAIRTGEAVGRYVIAPFAVIEEIHQLKRMGEYKRLHEGKLPGALCIDNSGAGDTRWPWMITMSGYLLVRIPLTYVLTTPTAQGGWGMGLKGAWLAMFADLYVRAVLVVGRFLQRSWLSTLV